MDRQINSNCVTIHFLISDVYNFVINIIIVIEKINSFIIEVN